MMSEGYRLLTIRVVGVLQDAKKHQAHLPDPLPDSGGRQVEGGPADLLGGRGGRALQQAVPHAAAALQVALGRRHAPRPDLGLDGACKVKRQKYKCYTPALAIMPSSSQQACQRKSIPSFQPSKTTDAHCACDKQMCSHMLAKRG